VDAASRQRLRGLKNRKGIWAGIRFQNTTKAVMVLRRVSETSGAALHFRLGRPDVEGNSASRIEEILLSPLGESQAADGGGAGKIERAGSDGRLFSQMFLENIFVLERSIAGQEHRFADHHRQSLSRQNHVIAYP
jgi:hypothetical protein